MRQGIFVFIIGLTFLSGTSLGLYSNVDSLIGGPMTVLDADGGWVGSDNLFEVQLVAKNTGAYDLTDVGMTIQFVWTDDHVFNYDNSSHNWSFQNYWLKVYGVQGQNDLLSMTRAVTNVPLSWETTPVSPIMTLQETDSVPVIWLGNIAAGQTIDFSLYFETSEQFYADAVGFFVAIPEPATISMIAAATLMAIRRRKTRI